VKKLKRRAFDERRGKEIQVFAEDEFVSPKKAGLLWSDAEFRMERGGRVFAGPDVEDRGFNGPCFGLWVSVLEFILAERELESSCFAGLPGNTREAFEFADGPGSRTVALVNIDLRDSVTRNRAGIGYR